MVKILYQRQKKLFFIKMLFWTLIVLFGALSVNAQTIFQFGFNGQLAFPQDEFKNNAANLGGGFGFDFIYDPPSVPFGIGASFGYIIYGHERYQEIVSTSHADFEVDVTTMNSIITGNVLLRFQPHQGRLRPYIEGLLGFNYLTTDTKIDETGYGDEVIQTNNFDDIAFSYGGGVGLMVSIYEKNLNPPRSPRRSKKMAVLMDFRMRYLMGGEAEYLKEGSIYRENGDLYYDVKMSRTDMITFQVGVTVNF